MRMLDVGSGAGDVALLAAELVGPGGEVVGVDVDEAALRIARARAQSLGLRQVTFIDGDVLTAELAEGFDAAVGRLVLMYRADPAEALRRIAAQVRPGGLVVFQELDLDPAIGARSLPEQTLWNETGQLVIETFARAGMQVRMGRQLFGTFLAAGLPAPTMRDEALVGGGPDFGGYAWLAGVARSLAPMMNKLAVADPQQLDLDTLADRIRDDTVAGGAVVWTPSFVGAYAQRPQG
jgi:SAM-dependent methyltransferase